MRGNELRESVCVHTCVYVYMRMCAHMTFQADCTLGTCPEVRKAGAPAHPVEGLCVWEWGTG